MDAFSPNQTAIQHPAYELIPALTQLIQKSMAPTTINVYERALTMFKQFLHKYSLPTELPNPPIVIALYATYLHQQKYAYRTIVTHLTAITHIHRCHQMAEPNNNFLIQKTPQGIKQSAVNNDCRMPITLSLLHNIHLSVNHIISSPRERIMYQAMYLLAFHAFLRGGEFTKSHGRSQNVIQYHQMT